MLPPFRQRRTYFFPFFLVLGIADIVMVALLKIYHISSVDFYIVVSYCSFISLMDLEYLKKKMWIFIGIGLVAVYKSLLKIGITHYVYFITTFHIAIILRILYLFIMVVATKQVINFFYLVLAFYEFTVLLKFFNYLFTLNVDAYTYFLITTLFELLVGIFFTTFREDSPKLVFKLK